MSQSSSFNSFFDVDSSPSLPTSSPSPSLDSNTTTKRKPRTSWIYKHMPDPDIERRYINSKGQEEWHCKYCSKVYSTNGGTRIIQSHLQKAHHLEESSPQEILLKKRQISIEDVLSQAGESRVTRRRLTTGGTSINPDIIEVLFVKLTATGNLPLQLVELPEFRDLVYYLNPDIDFWLPTSHQSIKTWLIWQYDTERIKIKSRIKGARTRIHLTIDLWASPNNLPVSGVVEFDEVGTLEVQ